MCFFVPRRFIGAACDDPGDHVTVEPNVSARCSPECPGSPMLSDVGKEFSQCGDSNSKLTGDLAQ